ncbi:MAG: S8 family serine peptidase [Chitinophagales bacterium]
MKRILTVFTILSIFFITSCQSDLPLQVESLEQAAIEEGRIANTYLVMFSSNYLTPLLELGLQFGTREEKRLYAENYRSQMIASIQAFMKEKSISQNDVIYYYTSTVTGFAAVMNTETAEKLRQDNRVVSVENDKVEKLPEYTIESVEEGSMRAQSTPCGITNAGGFADGSTKTTWIWIIDSGADTDHPDLNVNVTSPYATYLTGGSLEDCLGHGTHVAGTAAAKNNTEGVVGVSAGAVIVPVRIFGCTGSTSTSTVVAGIDHVGTYNIAGDAVNLSVGGYYGSSCATSYSGKTALENLSADGSFVSIAAGNNYGAFASNYAPACINATNICTVASMTCGKAWSSFSNKGKPPVDWIATGSSVYSTYLSGGYATLSGTSMAAPTVAGVCHARNALPVSGGTVTKSSVTYNIAVR